nr:retroviral aspartyl protease [Tanacetum cinerariifolium]
MPGHKCEGQIFTIEIRGEDEEIFKDYLGKRSSEMTEKTYPLSVFVAGGSKLVSQYMVKDFQWKIQGVLFTTDVMLLPVGGCELVLGIQWLSTLGNIQWNFQELKMEFCFKQGAYLTSICCMAPSATLHLMQCGNDHEISENVRLQ